MSSRAASSSRRSPPPTGSAPSKLVRTYADLPLGVTDASLVALAERHRVKLIATLDHRHFRVVRPAHLDAFTLVP